MRPGRLVKLTNCSAFKIAIVLGPSRVAGKLRAMTYSHQSRGWSHAHTVPESDIANVTMAGLAAHHRRTVRHALEDSAKTGYSAWIHTA
jgi:hypothetical protein